MNKLEAVDIKALLKRLGILMSDNKAYLCELDAKVGDGDLGLTMSVAFTKAAQAIADVEQEDIGKLLALAGMTMAKEAPSTMGTLMASGFMAGGKSLYGKEQMGAAEFAEFLESFSNALMSRGKANPGEKTIIDAIYPAANAAVESKNGTLSFCTAAAQQGAKRGLESTKDMMAVHGKAAVFREKTLGILDPGATVGWMLIKQIAEFTQ